MEASVQGKKGGNKERSARQKAQEGKFVDLQGNIEETACTMNVLPRSILRSLAFDTFTQDCLAEPVAQMRKVIDIT